MSTTTILDCKGLTCPQPLMKLKKAMGGIAVGEILELHATDPGAADDVGAFCRKTGQDLMEQTRQDGIDIFRIKRLK